MRTPRSGGQGCAAPGPAAGARQSRGDGPQGPGSLQNSAASREGRVSLSSCPAPVRAEGLQAPFLGSWTVSPRGLSLLEQLASLAKADTGPSQWSPGVRVTLRGMHREERPESVSRAQSLVLALPPLQGSPATSCLKRVSSQDTGVFLCWPDPKAAPHSSPAGIPSSPLSRSRRALIRCPTGSQHPWPAQRPPAALPGRDQGWDPSAEGADRPPRVFQSAPGSAWTPA